MNFEIQRINHRLLITTFYCDESAQTSGVLLNKYNFLEPVQL
jgi:hypothetical protein